MIPTRSRNAACSAPTRSNHGGRVEPEPALVGAAAPPPPAGLEVVGPLPAVLGPEHRAELLEADLQRARAPPAPPLVGVERVAQPVVVAVGLACARAGEPRVVVGAAEAPGAVGADVDRGSPCDDPLGERAADPAGAAEAVERQPGGDPEPGRPRQRSEQRVAVRGHRVGVAEQPDHAGAVEEREAPDRPLEQRREAVHVGLDRARAVVPGNPVDPARRRIALVAADQHPARLVLAVDEVVGVAEARAAAGHLARRGPPAISTCWCSTGTDGKSRADHLPPPAAPRCRRR